MVTIIINTLGRWSFVIRRAIEVSKLENTELIICYPEKNEHLLTDAIRSILVTISPKAMIHACPAKFASLYQQRTYAAQLATTNWITFLDDDDSLDSARDFVTATKELRFKPDYIVFAPRYVSLEPGWYNPRLFFQYYPRGYWLTCWNTFFPRELFVAACSSDDGSIIRAEDTVRWLRLLPQISFVRIVRRGWIEYNVNEHAQHTSQSCTLSDEQILGAEIVRAERLLAVAHPSTPLTTF